MLEIFKKQILNFLARRDYKPLKLSRLARLLGVSAEDYPAFKTAFKQLQQNGRVVIGAGNLVSLPQMAGWITGTFRANPKGFGFVTPIEPNSHGDLFISPGSTREAITGDTVVAVVVRKGKRGGKMQFAGEIVEILQRGQNRFAGTLQRHKDGWFVIPDGRGFVEPIAVDDVGAKEAKANDKVVVEILKFPTEKYFARAVIVELLGKAGRYASETASIIQQFQLAGEFDRQCLAQAGRAADKFDGEDTGDREDITAETVITIDPPDAKDFDDAISLAKDKDGNVVLGVHIADVSCFVEADSALDIEAGQRGNSVYLPGKTIPMLPEILSNGICSLQPGRKRFVKSVYITYDAQGKVLGRSFANSVICSKARLTYAQADRILRGRKADFAGEVIELLKDMEALARLIEQRRRKNGMIHLDLPEIELVMDKQHRVVDAHPADDSYPHTIIEMFMVEANEAVASLLDSVGVEFMRRIHPEPDMLATRQLGRFVKVCGFKVPKRLDRKAIQDLLEAVKGKPCSFAINLTVLRSLARAEYSPLHIGHYALASQHYCHFTSPIRRYADLMVHRLFECYLQQRLDESTAEEILPTDELERIGRHISFTEQQADDAEKELKTVLILQMLKEQIGGELDCVVTGLTNFGVFVQCQRFGIEGLIGLEDLGLDEWKYSAKSQTVVGRYSGKSVHLGRPMKVRIVSVNVPARRLNVTPTEPLVTSREQLGGKTGHKQRRKGAVKRAKGKRR